MTLTSQGEVRQGGIAFVSGRPAFIEAQRPPVRARNVAAVSDGVIAIRAELLTRIGSPTKLPPFYGDVELCLRARALNLDVVFTPHAKFVHGSSMKSPRWTPRSFNRLWAGDLAYDPYYNGNNLTDAPPTYDVCCRNYKKVL
jgi:GT2 family glycosyltransferase